MAAAKDSQWKDHLVIIGYGVNGRNVALSARSEGIPFVIVEMDPEIVMQEEKKGEPICFGDASQEAVLQYVGMKSARVAAIAISDPAATRRITELARRINPGLFIIVRTRYLQEMKPLHELGADEVIPEEFETSMEIFARVLERYEVPREKIEQFIDHIRSESYEMFRSPSREPYCNANLSMLSDEIRSLAVQAGGTGRGKERGRGRSGRAGHQTPGPPQKSADQLPIRTIARCCKRRMLPFLWAGGEDRPAGGWFSRN